MSAKTELEALGINLKGRTSGNIKTLCPKCSHLRKKKNDPCLSADIDSGKYKCHNADCDFHGMARRQELKFTVPDTNNTPLSDSNLQWLQKRGISKATILRHEITERNGNIEFNYFRKGELVNVKTRTNDKKFWMVQDAELIFYGLDFITDSDKVIITEGEMDALSFHEAGVFSSVSVPNGASEKTNRLDYLDNSYSFFENKNRIYLATDGDKPGRKLADDLAKRFGPLKCHLVNYPEGCKDANDVLVVFGPQKLKECIKDAKPYPIYGITEVKSQTEKILDLYNHGFPKGVTTGFDGFDKLLSFLPGQLTTITGMPGSGKSEFVDQLMLNIAGLHGWKWGIFSPENQPVHVHITKLIEKFTSKSFHSIHEDFKSTEVEIHESIEWFDSRFFFVNIEEQNLSLEGILAKAKELKLRYGIDGFLIDPYNCIEHRIPKYHTETMYISDVLTKLKNVCKEHDLHIFLVAHPRKMGKNKDGKYEVPTMYDISGSAHFFNKTDNGISLFRDYENNTLDVYVQKVRFKFCGQIGSARFHWDKYTGQYTEQQVSTLQ